MKRKFFLELHLHLYARYNGNQLIREQLWQNISSLFLGRYFLSIKLAVTETESVTASCATSTLFVFEPVKASLRFDLSLNVITTKSFPLASANVSLLEMTTSLAVSEVETASIMPGVSVASVNLFRISQIFFFPSVRERQKQGAKRSRYFSGNVRTTS